MVKGFLDLPWFLWAGISLVLAVVWIYVGPHTKIPAEPGLRYFIIRWGHSLAWLLLAINFFMRGMGPELNGGASFFAFAGGVVYVLFIITTFVVK